MSLIHLQQDNFNDNTISAIWSITGSALRVLEQNQRMEISHIAASEYNTLSLASTYDLTGSFLQVQVLSAGNQTLASHEAILGFSKDANNALWFTASNGNLSAFKKVAGVQTQVGSSITYDPAVHIFWRFREFGGTIFWDTSVDGLTWVNRWSLANPFAVTAVTGYLQSGCFNTEAVGSFAYFDNFNILTNAGTTEKSYNYRIYRGSTYLGMLPNVTSEFSLPLDINTTFAQITVEVGVSPDTSQETVSPLLDEQGNILLDEQGNTLYEERVPDLFGNENGKALIRNGNLIKVYEYSDSNPNGQIVFDGFIETYTASYSNNKFTLLCLSNGADLGEYVVQVGGYTSQFSQLVNNAADNGSVYGYGSATFQNIGQTFAIATAFNLRKMSVWLNWYGVPGIVVTLRIQDGASSYGNVLGTATATLPSTAGTGFIDFIFSANVPLPVDSYFFSLVTPDFTGFNFISSNGGPRVGGNAWIGNNAARPNDYTPISGEDLIFNMYSSNSLTDSTFTSTDPTTILTQSIDNYVGQGGAINYISGSTDLTGLSATYPFKLASVLDVIKKCLELAPYDWYFRVDPATGIIYFKETATTATHTLIKGRHFEHFDFTATLEDVRNLVYFSGGATAGVNLFTKYLNQTSITAIGRQKLERISDNRVTLQATADLQGNALLNEKAAEGYQAPITILASTYNINTIKPGQTITLAGHGNFLDRLVLQIARVVYSGSKAELTLGRLPPRQTAALAQAIDDVVALQTIANPSAPS